MTDPAKSDLCEDLVSLYLRLNGFFTSGFVVHAPLGQGNLSEIDVLAVRFPLHQEPEREFEFEGDSLLRLSRDHIEFAICEVKSGKKPKIQCNAALRNPDGIARVLRWLGMFEPDEIEKLVPDVLLALQPKEAQTPKHIVTIGAPKRTRIRFYFFAPDLSEPCRNQAFFVGGPSLLSFISRCVSPATARSGCDVNYGFGQWGHLAALVKYFKTDRGGTIPVIQDLYDDQLLGKFYEKLQ